MKILLLPRLLGIRRFNQDLSSAVLHPFGVLVLLMIQWHALIRHLVGTPAKWKGREYETDPSPKGAQETTERDVLTAKTR